MKKILIVDVNEKRAKKIEKKLTKDGFEVVGIQNSIDAFRMAHIEDPDLIIVELNMPGLNGFQLAQIFKEDADLRNTPLIGISDTDNDEDKQLALDYGFVEVQGEKEDLKQKIDYVFQSAG